ncbi:MAG TPA: alpha-glucan family phosphorylase [Candidatus Acidoferrum sp.]|nr:alpha-glucan family phosphorylase [Candidatus Acidoferrum sp.]
MAVNSGADSTQTKDPGCGMPVDPKKTGFTVEMRGKVYCFCSEYCMRRFLEGPEIAYFSMEIGIKSEIPTYSGGLGALAGDTVRSAADLGVPMVAVTLVSRKGYLKQKITETGQQLEYPDEWDPSKFMKLEQATATVRIAGRDIKIRCWHYEHESPTRGAVPVLFLDTDLDGNTQEDREITNFLYGGDERYRLKQEIVLGIGGARILDALNFKVRKYHMNEGHSSLLTLELLRRNELNPDSVRDLCVFTTHTPVAAAFDKFSYDLVRELLGNEYPLDALEAYGGQDALNMTLLAVNLSKHVNGVTKAHMAYSEKLFPGHHIRAVTNGVHSYTWTCPQFRELFDKHIPGWANEPELLVRVDEIPNESVWDSHSGAKRDMINLIKKQTGVEMNGDILTLGFARRATAYKRSTLIFSDLERLRRTNRFGKLQLVFAGKAHPRDLMGKTMIQQIHEDMLRLKNEIKIVYLENYDMDMAGKLTSGVDVWLNTPMPPFEASGTSGMKAAHNGVLNFSVLDGWWIEGCIEEVTGWSIGPAADATVSEDERRGLELEDLYDKLKYLVIPTFYEKRDHWIHMMKSSIGKVAYYFNSHRMMRRYITEAYL